MKKYKILKKIDDIYYSPFQHYKYGKLEEFIDKEMVLNSFDINKNKECSTRFYATDIDGLIYTNLSSDNKVVFEMEMGGKSIISSSYKQGYEKQKFIREIPIEEVKELVKKASDKMEWNYYEMLFPFNPLTEVKEVTEDVILLLKEWDSVGDSVRNSVRDSVGDSVRNSVRDSVWDSVRDSVEDSVGDSVWNSVWNSVWDSVRDSVGDSVWDSVGDSVWDSVRDSVGDSVRAYISSGFSNIKTWKYFKHKKGINPFQSGIDLWKRGFVPSFDGEMWRLHSGKKAKIVFEIHKEDLIK